MKIKDKNQSTGYSDKSLVEKLGIKDGMKAKIINASSTFIEELGKPRFINAESNLDFAQLFTKNKKELETQLAKLKTQIKPSGMIWVSWPKGGSKVLTDLNENIVREIGLKQGMVDVKVVAVDAIWSGLKLVYRLKDREGK